jgi:predicted RNase H-like HicB family nuclease
MITYPALIDGEPGAYGVVFPDIRGIGAMGYTIADAISNAESVLRDYVIEMEWDRTELAVPSPLNSISIPDGSHLVTIPLIPPRG